MDPTTESCVTLLLLRLYLPQPLTVAPLLPLFSEVVCEPLNYMQYINKHAPSFDEGAWLLLTLYLACGKLLYMWKC